ncbi:hypothetical protein N8482_00010 [Chitinophagales bacterium]|nr:hypothetical protein [Chitinophagales bacterium]
MDQSSVDVFLSKLRAEQNYSGAITAGFVSLLLCSILWFAFTGKTGYPMPYMPIVMAALIAIPFRMYGNGIEQKFSIAAAGLSAFGSFLGFAGNSIALYGQDATMGFREKLVSFKFSMLPHLMIENLGLFFIFSFLVGMAVAYYFSIKSFSEEEIEEGVKGF